MLVIATTLAQNKTDTKNVDIETYNLYLSGKWDELTEAAEDAIDNGIDFYYLRMRAGIAYYNMENFMSAVPHFEKALKYPESDSITNEYLYFSYLFSGRESDARVLSSRFSSGLKKKLNISNPEVFNGIYTESGYTFNTNSSKNKGMSPHGIQNNFSEKKDFSDLIYFSFNLSHLIGNRLSLFHGYNFVSNKTIKQITEQLSGEREFSTGVNQNEYFLNAILNLGKGFELGSSLHYLNVKIDDMLTEFDTVNFSNPPLYSDFKKTMNDFVALISLSKTAGTFKFRLSNSFSNLNEATQFQNTLDLLWFPSGNLNFYTISSATLLSQREWGNKEFKSSGLFDQKLGFKVFSKLWTEVNYTFGDITNFNEENGFVVFNNTDIISNRFGLNLIFPLSNNIEIALRYQYFNLQLPEINYTSNTNYTITYLNNKIHKIIGGLKWTF